MVQDIMEFVNEYLNRGEKVALVTLTYKSGNAPGAQGQIMAVLKDGTTCGTIGGGAVENSVIEQAKEAITNNTKVFEFSKDLSKEGMICGGDVAGFGNVLGIGERLVLFGAGHVSQAIAKVAQTLGFSIIVIDDRKDLEVNFENVTYLSDEYSKLNKELLFGKNSYIVIATRGHTHDREALEYCLQNESAYLGMIGSKRKVKEIFNMLLEDKYTIEQLEKVYAPIGLKIADGTPAEIAISILAEILVVKNQGELINKKHSVQLI